MKKIVIAVVSVIYVVAIVFIAFLGIRAEVNPAKIITEVETIVLDEIKGSNSREYSYYYDGTTDEDKKVYSVLARPDEEEINKSTGGDANGDLWNIGTEKIHYIIKIFNFNFVYDTPNWVGNQQKGTYQLKPSVIPENSTMQDVLYSTTMEEDIVLSETGLITFFKLEKIIRFTVNIRATDNSGTYINVRFLVQKYN